MLYREMPGNNDKLSILGFGCMRFPGGQFRPDEKRSIAQIRDAIGEGINYFDTAWPYHGGKSEVILGKALKDGYRQKVKIADKLPHWLCKTREDMDFYLNEQLKRLDDTVIDYYLIHALEGVTWNKAVELGVKDFLDKAKESGKIINAGFSFHGHRDDFKEIIDGYNWDFCQIQFNILDEHDQAGIEGLEYAASKNIGVIVMEPLRGGSLSGKLPDAVEKIYKNAPVQRSNAEWALRWVWNHPGVITVLSGMTEEAHIEENLRIASDADVGSLNGEEMELVTRAADTFREVQKVPCTGCQYCMPCPKNINIPLTFSFYNNKYLFNQGLISRMMYVMQSAGIQGRDPGLASQCVDCGACVKHCPQKIDIPNELKTITKEFEGPLSKVLAFTLRKVLSSGSRKKQEK